MSGLRTQAACHALADTERRAQVGRSIAAARADFAGHKIPKPPQWARDRVNEICGGGNRATGDRLTDDMPNIVFLRLAEYVARIEVTNSGAFHAGSPVTERSN